jgi:hypothetical protein
VSTIASPFPAPYSHLPRGDALWRVGDRRLKVRHHLSPVERWIVDTDERMSS